MSSASVFARGCVAAALIVAGAAAAHAQSVINCTTSGDLQTAINSLGNGQTLTITGTCTGAANIFIGKNITLTAGGGGATIDEAIVVLDGFSVTMTGLTIDGTGLTSTEGVTPDGGGTVTLSGCTIEHWTDGVKVNPFGTASISGGIIENNTGSGINAQVHGSAAIGEIFGGTSLPVEITANGVGVTVDSGGDALLNALNIHANTGDGVFIHHGGARIVGGTIANNGGDGLDIVDGSVLFTLDEFGGSTPTAITGNTDSGIAISSGTLDIDQANIQSNTGAGLDATAGSSVSIGGGTITGNSGGGIDANSSSVKLRGGLSLAANSGGPAISVTFSTLDDKGGTTIMAPVSLGAPAILAYRSGLDLNGTHVTGPNNSNTLGAFGGTSVLLRQVMFMAADSANPALQISDGSSVVSAGGNTISNSASSATAITVQNGSTFIEETNAVLTNIFTPAADTITGAGAVQMQSNMELGTGASVPSNWTGSITVAQNSSFRMHGGMTISGGVALAQGSNGFFNKVAGGNDIVNGNHVTCVGTNSTHITGGASVTPPVTMATTGSGCYAF